MKAKSLHSGHLVAAVVFLAGTLVLAVQLLSPTPVVVSVGENNTNVAELGGYFGYRDVAVAAVSACAVGASGTYLLIAGQASTGNDASAPVTETDANDASDPSEELLEARREEWEETADRLADNEAEIYQAVLEADGVLAQSDIVERTDLSKATVSRSLDSLETKNLVERKRRGMGNVVLLL
ncbi:helix-turn-helix transcriptional regulator [Halovenus marina]|uniref:helix-turn-helix transcriptional regulator n=1 Tax=Halovenus marina TaxID=3396621 RepID=UPI003F5476C0